MLYTYLAYKICFCFHITKYFDNFLLIAPLFVTAKKQKTPENALLISDVIPNHHLTIKNQSAIIRLFKVSLQPKGNQHQYY